MENNVDIRYQPIPKIVEFKEPSIRLISDDDKRAVAWKKSRPWITAEVEDIDQSEYEKVDLSLAGLRTICLDIDSSAGFRELITTIRPYHMWAQTSRVNPLLETKFPKYQESNEIDLNMIMTAIKHRVEVNGEHQDTARMGLPLAYMTGYTVKLDFRTYVGLVKWMKLYNAYYEEYGKEMERLLGINVDNYKYGMPVSSFVMTPEMEKDQVINLPDGTIWQSLTITWAQRAQLVRHVGLSIRDELPSILTNHGIYQLEREKLASTVRVVIIGYRNVIEHMVRHRVCWLAQINLWQNLTVPYLKRDGLARYVPCHCVAEDCPYSGDMQARLDGKDPGIPCSIYTGDKKYIQVHRDRIGDSPVLEYYEKV